MAESEQTSILRWIRRMTGEMGGASDAQLLNRFVSNRDEAAFELLLWRYARLVFGVCRRVLHDLQDAEDAFQATFLALARHASRISRREAVAGFLHKVAYRTALTAQRQRKRHGAREKPLDAESLAVPAEAEASLENQELRHLLDEEIGRLPERFRAAVVLCYLEGKSVDEAALLLGCPRGTVASRLARARQRLRGPLARRGLAPTVALAALPQANAAPPPLALIPTLTAAALRYTAAGTATESILTPRITALTEEVLRSMFLHKLKTGIVLSLAFLGILLAGGGLALRLYAKAPKAEPPRKEAPDEKAADREKPARAKQEDEGPRTVIVIHPIQCDFTPSQAFQGYLQPHAAVEVRPTISGFVEKVYFKAGARVKKGDVLFELDSRAAQLALDKAEAELAVAEAKKKQSDNAVADRFAVAEASVKIAKLEVARARLELDATKVRAPMSGEVSRSLVEPGTLVFRGQDRATLLTTIVSLDPISLVFDMDERSYLRYQRRLREKKVKGVGSTLLMHVSDEEGFLHKGTLESFADHFNVSVGTVSVRGSFPNPGQMLLPGMFALIRMPFGPPRKVLEIPEEAILSDQGKKYVLVVDNCKVAEKRAVTLGPEENGMRIIEKGLSPGDWVITSPTKIRPGDRVAPRKKAP